MAELDERQGTIRAFAGELHQLRVSTGTPSFRKMASFSGCVSHTTLAEAEKGLRLPSWETTREFVKACQGDEADWHGRWQRAKSATTPEEPVLVLLPPLSGAEEKLSGSREDSHLPVTQQGKRRLRIPLVGGVVTLLGVGTLVAVLAMIFLQDSAENPALPPKGALIEGDHSRFIRDVTIPDETQVPVGENFVKVWEVQNAGKVIWRDRYLQRQDLPVSPDTCRTPDRVRIGDTLPNERILISVTVTAPSSPTTCKVDWKMVDNQGREFLPNSRPVFFLVHVVNPPDK
ncbi:MAG: NBR1-Ig-like domain-containing protein [Pseudonocardiales bacterium]